MKGGVLTHCRLKILRNGFAPLNVYVFFMSWASSRRLSAFRVFFYTLSADLPLFVALALVFFFFCVYRGSRYISFNAVISPPSRFLTHWHCCTNASGIVLSVPCSGNDLRSCPHLSMFP